jgi:hypothetical protein
LATPTPWIHEHSGLPFVNCGSVGKPDRGDGPALFALLEATDDGVSASIHRTDYDTLAVDGELADLAGYMSCSRI